MHTVLRSRVTSALAAAGISTLLLFGGVAVAQDATPEGDMPAFQAPAGCEVYAEGLYNPRYIAFDSADNLYISEAGDGGDEPQYGPTGEGTPESSEPLSMFGNTGQVSVVSTDGSTSVLVDGLPSYTFGTEVVGPAGIVATDDTVYVAIGGPGPGTALIEPAQYRDAVIAIDVASGEITQLADIGEYERTTNPDPNAVDSNLYGLAMGNDGMLYVADAGGNTIYTVDPASGELAVLATLPGVPMEGFENPARGGAQEIDPVPTGLTPAPGGGVYVGLLTGGPFPPGAASILKVDAEGNVSTTAEGLTMVTGVETGPGGQIYAVQLSENFMETPPAAGSVVRIGAFNQPYPVLSGLPIPNDLAFDSEGNMYVVVMTTAPAGTPPGGMVLKCDLAAIEAGGEATPDAEATPVALTVDMADITYSPKALAAAAGSDVVLTIVNTGFLPHDFNIDALGIHTGYINAGESVSVTINAGAGSYTFYCGAPGHQAAGMVGTLSLE